MSDACPECSAPTGDDPWCGNCGALLEGGTARARVSGAPRPRWVAAAAVTIVVLLAAVAWPDRGGHDDADLAAPVVPVEEQTILPPEPPPAPSDVRRQFAAEGRVVADRPRGDDDPPLSAPDDLVFTAADGTVDVDVADGELLGRVDGDVVWRRALPATLAFAPVRTGTSVLVALVDGTVASLDPGDGDVWWERVLDATPTAAASDGGLLLVGTAEGQVLRLDPSGNVVTTVDVGPGAVERIVVGRPATVVLPDRVVEVAVDG